MVICGREKCKVAFGEDPRAQQQRVFLTKEAAIVFMRIIADEDQRQIMMHARTSRGRRVCCAYLRSRGR